MDDHAPPEIRNFGDIVFTPGVKAAQEHNGSRAAYAQRETVVRRTVFTAEEIDFIQGRDSFYLATVGENGWPYIQHRGGPKGFLRVLDAQRFGFPDFRGNRQYVSTGNLAGAAHACLFLMDYPHQERLKIWAEAEISEDAEVIHQFTPPDYPAVVERVFLFRMLAFDWNCPQHITPRYTPEEYLAEFGPPPA